MTRSPVGMVLVGAAAGAAVMAVVGWTSVWSKVRGVEVTPASVPWYAASGGLLGAATGLAVARRGT